MKPSVSQEEKVRRGYRFQVQVSNKLLSMGYLEGQVLEHTATPPQYEHKRALRVLGMTHFLSPDILVISRKGNLAPRFGLLCDYRSNLWYEYGNGYITMPPYQAEGHPKMAAQMGVKLYYAFGYSYPPETAEARFCELDAPTEDLRIPNEHAAARQGRPFGMRKGFDWATCMTFVDFVTERIRQGDEEPLAWKKRHDDRRNKEGFWE